MLTKKIIAIWLFVLILSLYKNALGSEPNKVLAQTFSIKKVIAGNILQLNNGEEIELAGVDISRAEELAKTYIETYFEGQQVILSYEGNPVEGSRPRAYVFEDIAIQRLKGVAENCFLSDFLTKSDGTKTKGVFINASLIKAGYATVSERDLKYKTLFDQLSAEAREERRGIWSSP